MSTMKTYDPKEVVVTMTTNSDNTSYLIGGFADGTAIKVMRKADAYASSVGMDGDTSRTKSPDHSGEITLSLAQTSISNDVLSIMERQTSNGDTATILISDIYGNTKVSSSFVWIKKVAEIEFAKALTNREWILEAHDVQIFVGGSNVS